MSELNRSAEEKVVDTAINIVLSGVIPIWLGLYLVLLARGRVQARDEKAKKKVSEWRTPIQVIDWLCVLTGVLSVIIELVPKL